MSLMVKRRSIRNFQNAPVRDAFIEALLKSAMQAPSARNQQPWHFIVIKNRALLDALSEVSQGARHLKKAPLAILTLMKEDVPAPHMRPQDMAAATQNILLEATNLNLGAVWIGVYPLEERINKVKALAGVETLTPFSLIAIGHPDTDKFEAENLRYDTSRIAVIE